MAEERRIVTVLFADVAGSTALGESLDAEDVRALLGRYYELARAAVEAYGGTVEKFIGDAVMAVFGLPRAHGDDPARALSAALEIRDRLAVDEGLGGHLQGRFGISTGEVVAATGTGTADFLVTGDTVNVAARLQQAAEVGAVLCTLRTTAAAGPGFSFGQPVTLEVKGRTAPLTACELTGRHPQPLPPLKLPLFGREADLEQLELICRRCFREKRPYMVSLIGPAGTGKTRLLEEFLDRLPGLAESAAVARAQCLPYGQRLTYWPVRIALLRSLGLDDDTEPEIVRTELRRWLEGLSIDEPAEVAAVITATIGAGEAEVTDRSSLLVAWRTVMEAAARQRPLVVVFEDLHWSSDSLLDLVEFVMQPRGDAPIMMIALTRPELLDRRPAWGGGRHSYVALSLEALPESAVREIVSYMMAGAPSEVVDPIAERAEGNPFYAVELVRSVMEVAGSPPTKGAVERALLALPDTIHGTVLARLDSLPPAERRLLQLGAVHGRTFQLAGLAALEDTAEEAQHLCESLAARQLIRPSQGRAFTFRHILIREVAYQTLPRAERARLHAAAGRWLESTSERRQEALAELIAYHYREAASLGSAFGRDRAATEVRQNAVRWLTLASEVAWGGAASLEAARHLREAIELASPDLLPELYERLGDLNEGGNATPDAYSRALDLCKTGRPPEQRLRVLAKLLEVHTRFQGSVGGRLSLEQMEELRSQGRELCTQVKDESAVARFLIADAFFPFWLELLEVSPPEAVDAAVTAAETGLELARRLQDADLCSAALDALSACALMRGRWRESLDRARERLSFGDRISLTERMDAQSMVAWGHAILGELRESERAAAAGLATVQPGQIPSWVLHLMAWRLYALTLLGAWPEVLALGDRAYELWRASGRISASYALRGFISALDVAWACGDEDRAERSRDAIREICAAFPDAHHQRIGKPFAGGDLEALEVATVRGFRATHSWEIEHTERALAFLLDRGWVPDRGSVGTIVEFAARRGYPVLEAQGRRSLGVAGRDAEQLNEARMLFERMGAAPYAARARAEWALVSGDTPSLQGALAELERLGDLRQVERLASPETLEALAAGEGPGQRRPRRVQ
ncbi:MAG: ATP-binding protein [Candidatus Dormibacterales bacterium]